MTDSGFASTEDFFNRFDQDPFHKYLGLTLEEHKADFARVRLSINESTPTGIGAVSTAA